MASRRSLFAVALLLLPLMSCAHNGGWRRIGMDELLDPGSGELSVGGAELLRDARWDCNENGYDDSLDTALGYEDDLNKNHFIDRCDGDTSLCFGVSFSHCRELVREADSLFLYRTFAGNQSVFIQYYVPRLGGPFRLVVYRKPSHVITTLADSSGIGMFEARWNLRDSKGNAVPSGRVYSVDLHWNGSHLTRKVFWRSPPRGSLQP